MLPLLPVLAALLLPGGALAAPTPEHAPVHDLGKRHSDCFSYNKQGCQYGLQGKNGAVATEVGTCSEIGIDILQKGGNAVDAMISSALCVGTIAAYHSGIGGGGFMIVRFKNKNGTAGYETIDFRETMPAAGNVTLYSAYGVNQTKSTIGGLAVGVPGEVRAWEALWKRHGSLPWPTLFAPAIDLARNGFPVNKDLAAFLVNQTFIQQDPVWAESYAPNGTLLKEGDRCYRRRFASTLERIANEGAGIMYDKNSTIAQNTVKKVIATGGIMTADDLAGYKVLVKEPSFITYRNKKIYSTRAPSSGAITLSALKIFEGFSGSLGPNAPGIAEQTQKLVEANKFAYGQRATFGDPAFTENVTRLEAAYLTEPVAAAARARIVAGQTFPVSYYNPSNYYPTREGGTSHLAAVDGKGMAVSLTTTVNLIWGSRVMTDDGFVLNNEMDDFSSPGQVNAFGFAASPINFIAGGKRPQSSICSSIVENAQTGELVMATGSAGGSRIITTTLQQLHHYIDQGLNATISTGYPRWHDQLSGTTFFERASPAYGLVAYPNSTVDYFRSLGYNVTLQDPTGGSTSHAISRLPNGDFLAASDPRKPAGYGAAY